MENILPKSWGNIQTAADLKRTLLGSAERIEKSGHPKIAADWRDRISRMPQSMKKEAINYVLIAASSELKKIGKSKNPSAFDRSPLSELDQRKFDRLFEKVDKGGSTAALTPTEKREYERLTRAWDDYERSRHPGRGFNPWAIQISEQAKHKREAREMLRALRKQQGFKGGRIYSVKSLPGARVRTRKWTVQAFMQDEPEAKAWLPEGMRRVYVPAGAAKRLGYHGNPFTRHHLRTLRSEFSKVERVDPDSPTLEKIRASISRLSLEELTQLRYAKIPFLSSMARSEISKKRGYNKSGLNPARLGSGVRFRALKAKLARRPGVYSPGALAAWIGRRKYGKRRFAKLGAGGKRRRSRLRILRGWGMGRKARKAANPVAYFAGGKSQYFNHVVSLHAGEDKKLYVRLHKEEGKKPTDHLVDALDVFPKGYYHNPATNPRIYYPGSPVGGAVTKGGIAIHPYGDEKAMYVSHDTKDGHITKPKRAGTIFVRPSRSNPELMVMLNKGRKRKARRSRLSVRRRNPILGVRTIGELIDLQEKENAKPFSMRTVLTKKDWILNVAKELGVEHPSMKFLKSLDRKMPVEVLTSFMHKADRTYYNPRKRRSRLSVRRRRSAPTIRYQGRRWYFLPLMRTFGKSKAKQIWRKHRKTMKNAGRRGTRRPRGRKTRLLSWN